MLGIFGLDSRLLELISLASGREKVTEAALSPDGQAIAYATIEGKLEIISLDGDLIHEELLPTPKPGQSIELLSWSPNGQILTYIWNQIGIQFNSYGPLFVIATPDGQPRQLSPDGVYDGFPVWSLQSNQIAVVRRENVGDKAADFDLLKLHSNLWVVDIATGEWRQLTQFDGEGVWSPAWTPDGAAVVFLSNTGEQVGAWMINADGSNLHQLAAGQDWMPRAIAIIP
jgi:TolB protein